MEPDYFETCKELAQLCIDDNCPEFTAYLIQTFCDELLNGETPHMALVLARRLRDTGKALEPPTGEG